MKRTGLYVMGLILMGMAGLYFLQGSEEFEEATYSVPATQLSIDPARIVRVDITRPGGFVRLERLRGEWKVTEPVFAGIDQERLRALQDGMAGFRLVGLVSTNPRKQGVLQVDEHGTGLVLVSDDGRSLSLVVGKSAPTGGNAFVRPALSDTVYLASGLTPAVVNRDLLEWRTRTVFRTAPEGINELTIVAGSERHVIRRSGDAWAATSGPVPADLIRPTLSALADIQARGFIDTALIIRNRPQLELDVAGARPARFELYSLGVADSNYLLKTSLSPAIAVVSPSLARGLNRLVASIAPPPPPKPVAKAVVPAPKAPVSRPPAGQTQTGRVQPDRTRPGTTQAAVPPPAVERGARRPSSRKPAPATTQLEESGTLTVHIVKRGESMISIARKYDVTVEQLKQWNGMQGENVVPGMEMYVFVKPGR